MANKKKKQAEAVQPAPAAPSAEDARSDYQEKLQQRLYWYARQGYAPTHKLCSTVAYLVGVKKEFFYPDEHSLLERAVYDRMDRNRDFQLVRLLCTLRNEVLQHCSQIFHAFRANNSVNDFITPGLVQKIYRLDNRFDMTPRRQDVYAYLIQINDAVGRALDVARGPLVRQLKADFADEVNYNYLRSALLFPGGTRQDNISELTKLYAQNSTRYPYRCYMNLAFAAEELPNYNLFNGDDDLMEWLYRMNQDTVANLWKFRTRYGVRNSVETLHKFLTPVGNYTYHILIDGGSMQADQVLALLQELRPEELERVSTILLFCCNDVYQNWRYYLQEYADRIHKVEVRSTVTAADRQKDIATNMSLNQFGVPSNTAVVLVTRNETVFGEVHEEVVTAQRRSLCLATVQDAPDLLLNTVSRSGLSCCYLDELEPPRFTNQQQQLTQILERKFPLALSCNLKELLQQSILELPVEVTAQDQEAVYQQALQSARLEIGPDGAMRILL